MTKAVAGERKQSWSILGSRCWPMEVAGQQVVKKNVFQMSEFLKSVPSNYANNMGGDTVEAGKKSFPQMRSKKRELSKNVIHKHECYKKLFLQLQPKHLVLLLALL